MAAVKLTKEQQLRTLNQVSVLSTGFMLPFAIRKKIRWDGYSFEGCLFNQNIKSGIVFRLTLTLSKAYQIRIEPGSDYVFCSLIEEFILLGGFF